MGLINGLSIHLNNRQGELSLAGILVSAFKARVEADGGSVENTACLTTDVEFLTQNP